ncbi:MULTISPECIES: hypothetical protein [Marinobacter]|jgi:hypothetical protein|uniref:Uncharacterized protein n=1 Tax=Marinobacter salsuginis TaxID=418719 RepID=A0A5M3PL59_9GAMM|nr:MULTISPECIES: hypothetical protein [Marinobacter]GBO83469.1 hypothetical protein MS5N3_09200 [Marinobacter salsuginis]|tara:strand:+ start:126 stop:296 length:171 start_codon:yes stop_codon:yes gene_type:complete
MNTNLDGDNVYRDIVLGRLLCLASGQVATNWFDQLVDHKAISEGITALISAATAPK